MRVNFFVLILLGSLLTGCDKFLPDKSDRENVFSVSPGHVSEGQTFIMSLPENHPKNFAIFTPNQETFFVHGMDYGLELWSFEDNETSKDIEISTADLKGLAWADGVKATTSVFKTKGVYHLYFADNLETESENTYSLSAKITYK